MLHLVLRPSLILLATVFLSCALFAQTDVAVSTLEAWPQTVATTVTLGYVPEVESFAPLPHPPRPVVSIAPGTTVRLAPPFAATEIAGIAWSKDDQPLSSTAFVLEISAAAAANSGTYRATVLRPGLSPWTSDPVTLRVLAPARQVLNLSSRATLTAANPALISGFVVPSTPDAKATNKLLFIRAIGPSLAKFGVSHPLARPHFKFFNARGQELTWVFTTPDPKQVAAIVGAFPLEEGTRDLAVALPFPTGVYTVHVTGLDDPTGDVLLEIYEVPDTAFDAFFYGGFPTAITP